MWLNSVLPSRSHARKMFWQLPDGWRDDCNSRWNGGAMGPPPSSSPPSPPTAGARPPPPAPPRPFVRAARSSRPLRDPDDIRELFVERLAALADAFDPGFGFDMARLSVVVAESCPPEQIGIGGSEDASELCRLVDRLSARLGPRRVR